MDTVLWGLKCETCFCYLDDIIFGQTYEEHNHRLDLFLSCLKKAALTLNAKKYRFGKRETLVLGHLVERNGLRPDLQKSAAISNLKTPQSHWDLQSSLGLCSYFRCLIPNFAPKVQPPTALQQKDVPFHWARDCHSAFAQLMFMLISGFGLRHFDSSAPTEIRNEASKIGLGAVLTQRHDNAEHVVAYASRSLSKAQRNHAFTGVSVSRFCRSQVSAIDLRSSFLSHKRPSFPLLADAAT